MLCQSLLVVSTRQTQAVADMPGSPTARCSICLQARPLRHSFLHPLLRPEVHLTAIRFVSRHPAPALPVPHRRPQLVTLAASLMFHLHARPTTFRAAGRVKAGRSQCAVAMRGTWQDEATTERQSEVQRTIGRRVSRRQRVHECNEIQMCMKKYRSTAEEYGQRESGPLSCSV